MLHSGMNAAGELSSVHSLEATALDAITSSRRQFKGENQNC